MLGGRRIPLWGDLFFVYHVMVINTFEGTFYARESGLNTHLRIINQFIYYLRYSEFH